MSDAVFDTPLTGTSLVEASAGTGKTFALAGLYVRAVIEGGLRPQQILAVTFTEAATQELRARVHLRLQQAQAMAAVWSPGDPPEREGDDGETGLLRRMLHAAVAAGESPLALRLRLARAARDLEQAQIATIHGFCRRLLAEHALEAGLVPDDARVETSQARAHRELAVALWREHAGDPAGAAFLRRRFGGIDGLCEALGDLLSHEPLLPDAQALEDAPTLDAAWTAARTAFARHGAEAREALERALGERVISSAQDKMPDIEVLWAWFDAQDDRVPPAWPKGLERIGTAWLRTICLKGREDRCPCSPLFDAVDALLAAEEADMLRRLHAFRRAALRRNAERKAALQVRDFDDLIGQVHAAVRDDAHRGALARAVRERYRLALIDEFQDTDGRQWDIFRSLFVEGADGCGLVLVGDPKQAIYRFRGGDVQTYVAARGSVEHDGIRLERNFRSRPCVLDVTNRLFQGLPPGALGSGIGFEPVAPGGRARDDDLQLDGEPAPPLAVHVVPERAAKKRKGGNWNKAESIGHAAALCAEAVRERLQLAREGRLMRRDGGALRPVEPRDCAVLVRTHAEAAAVRRELARRNVPAVTVDRTSLFAGEEARDLLALLLALLHADDDGRMRAALATPLFGLDAAAIEALEDDAAALRARQRDFDEWRARWQRHGPLAMLAQVVAAEAPRLLALDGGERRIANLLQLGELLQEASARSLGLQGQVDWLQSAIANPDHEDEAQQPRLESDAGRVQILTLHKSKGLEFPLVFLPFCGIGRDALKAGRELEVAVHHVGGQRVRQVRTKYGEYPGTPPWADAVKAHFGEDRAEDMRLLYVGLTRAREALWLCCGALAANDNTALHVLLGGSEPSGELCRDLGLEPSTGFPPEVPERLAPQQPDALPPARTVRRVVQRDWWVHSFSQLHRQAPQGLHALEEEAPAADEPGPVALPAGRDMRFAGPRFGNVLHHALEHADFSAWRGGDGLPEGQRDVLMQAFEAFGYRREEAEEGLPLLVPLIARTLRARVPGPGGADFRLCDLDGKDRIDEMEFHFALRGGSVGELLSVLHAHGVLRGRQGFGAWRSLSGLMTGKIDLTCRVDGRLYVIDYKTNTLPAYDAGTIAQAMADSEYDWQALLYLVALQRWLRSRLGGAYDFDTHVGGVRYLFCRGLDPAVPGQGVHVLPFTRELVDAVDAVLAAPPREVVA